MADSSKIVSIAGLGNVGSTMLTALTLYPREKSQIDEIIIYDLDENLSRRWEMECNQIYSLNTVHPRVSIAKKPEELFRADYFAFCVSVGVPEAGEEGESDIRLRQFRGNAGILEHYTELAVRSEFKGIFAVVSDPVDHLTRYALEKSGGRLLPRQFVGLGLGVMYARAKYLYPEGNNPEVFGAHGDLLEVINDPENYNAEISEKLTERVRNFNLEIRKLGYKPYTAPAISSGALALTAIIKKQPFYGAVYEDGIVWGSKLLPVNEGWERILPSGNIEIERLMQKNRKKVDAQYRSLLF
jgi:malate/lactate dehydrogenase